MNPLQLLDKIPHILHTRPEALTNKPLHLLIHIQEALDQLAIHEAERLRRFPNSGSERAVEIEVDIAERADELRHAGLQAHEQVLGRGGDEGD